jgi:hypothetical protein
MDVIGNLDFKGMGGKLKRAVLASGDFPLNPSEGEFLFKDQRVFLCVKILNGLPFWIPLTQVLNTVRFDQATPALEWSINHNLGVNLGLVQVYDASGKQILPEDIDCSQKDTALIVFNVPTAGSAVIMYGDALVGGDRPVTAYEQSYTSASTTWVVAHGLGYYPAITCIVDNYVVQPEAVVNDSVMQTTITFSTAQVGSVRCV